MADIALATSTKLEIMAEKLIVAAQVTLPAGVAINKGQVVSIHATTGNWQLADADVESAAGQCFLALRTVAANEALTASKHCCVSGFDLGSANFGTPIYLSGTAGAMGTAAASGGNSVIVGRIEPLFGNGATPDRVLRFSTMAG